MVANPESKSLDDPGRFIPIELVEAIRPRVKRWREAGYPGATGTTRKLLDTGGISNPGTTHAAFSLSIGCHRDPDLADRSTGKRTHRIEIPSDGGPFRRYCSKMATGSGKTIVMTMLIAWQALNKIADPLDSATGRIEVLYHGVTMVTRSPILGIGIEKFAEEEGYTAHNAYLLAATELECLVSSGGRGSPGRPRKSLSGS